MSADRLCQYTLLFEADIGLKMDQDGQSLTWRRGIKALPSGLSRVGRATLPSLLP